MLTLLALAVVGLSQDRDNLTVPGLIEPVEIIKDRWGISHIYAKNQRDLFFAQGFNVARDRLFQLELWRRRATGTVAEILGRRALDQDIGARLLQPRLDMVQELEHYHPDGVEIIGAFVRGINAYIDLCARDPKLLPVEFGMLGIRPGHWTEEVVVSRHNGLFRNVSSEVSLARRVSRDGLEATQASSRFEPGNPILKVHDGLDLARITNQVLGRYRAGRSGIRFSPDDVSPEDRDHRQPDSPDDDPHDEGSNNWVVAGSRTASGLPIMANDPHRSQQIPSLRYWVHLVAPGWNVIGGGEPALPGVSIGHNEFGAWGLTIFAIDQEDLYVYATNPDNPDQYRYQGRWEDMVVVEDTFSIKGEAPVTAELRYTRHGPVLFEEEGKAYALRAAWREIGGAPYLASLRMDQARNWEEFREACSYSRTPSENMVWADVHGDIGWQAVGIAPIRKGWHGLLPVPGDGRFEWHGYLPIKSLPHVHNPDTGYIATANENNIPRGYPYALGYSWSAPYRSRRIQEVLGSGLKFDVAEMMQLQVDELSLPARQLVPLLRDLEADGRVETARQALLGWDLVSRKSSSAAAIWALWRDQLSRRVSRLGAGRSLTAVIDALIAPDGRFGDDPTAKRDELLLESLGAAVEELASRFGEDMSQWRYGSMHQIALRHPLSRAIAAGLREKFDLPTLPRGGSGNTVNQTGSGSMQRSGASFRIIADTSNWDRSVGTNNPGQSGDPNDPHYRDLYDLWARDKYFPVFYTRPKVESVAGRVTLLEPAK